MRDALGSSADITYCLLIIWLSWHEAGGEAVVSGTVGTSAATAEAVPATETAPLEEAQAATEAAAGAAPVEEAPAASEQAPAVAEVRRIHSSCREDIICSSLCPLSGD